MNRDSNKQSAIILAVIGILPVVWLGLLIAPSVKGGLPEILPSLLTAFNDPFHIELCGDSLKTVLVLLLLYGMGIGIYLSTRRNYRKREEHGSAKWGSAKAIDKKYRQSPPSENKLMTQNVRIGLNAKKHRRNLNTLVCGGSGAGKTRFYCKPNLMQTSNSSQVILDPKGEILRDVGNLLEKAGYEIKVLDLISMEKSHCYNPFVYLRNDNDIQRLVTNLFKSTTPKGSQSNDPFWDTAASMLLLALIFYLHYEAPEEEKLAQYLVENLREVEHCTLRFMSHPSCGSYVELKPKASSWNRDPDPDYLVYLDDKTQMLNALPYIYDLQGAQVTEVCSVRDFLCEGYCGCDYAQLQSKLSYPDGLEPWIFNLTIRSERSPKYISEEVEIGEELGLIELRRSMNIDFFRVNQDALMTATISMTLEEFETMANDVRQVNENACARIRAMLKKGKLKIS